MTLPAYLLRPTGRLNGVIVAMDDRGQEHLADRAVCREALTSGWAFCGVDARAVGELASAHPNWLFAIHLLLGDHLPWRQGWDLSQAAQYLNGAADFSDLPVILYGNGPGSSLAVSYALAMPAVKRLRRVGFLQQGGFLSFHDFLERPLEEMKSFRLQQCAPKDEEPVDREIPPAYFVFDAPRLFDLRDLLAGSGASGLVIDPIDGDWNVRPPSVAQRRLPPNARTVEGGHLDAPLREFLGGRLKA